MSTESPLGRSCCSFDTLKVDLFSVPKRKIVYLFAVLAVGNSSKFKKLSISMPNCSFFGLCSFLSICVQKSWFGLHCIRSQDSVPLPPHRQAPPTMFLLWKTQPTSGPVRPPCAKGSSEESMSSEQWSIEGDTRQNCTGIFFCANTCSCKYRGALRAVLEVSID